MNDAAPVEGLVPARDRSLSFAVPARDVRGRLVRLDTSINAILAAHQYPPVLAQLLGEALVVTALLGATLRETGGGLTVQAQADGAVSLMVCDYNAGQLRGYLRGDPDTPAGDLACQFGSGHLAITLDPTDASERYQGIVPLEGANIGDAIESYFRSSEQLPTLIRAHVAGDAATGYSAGGLLLQYLPRSEDGKARLFAQDDGLAEPLDWQHMRTLAATIKDTELVDPMLSEETLLWHLFHEEDVRLQLGPTPARGCRCSIAHIKDVIERFPESERIEMRGADGLIGVDCQFCARVWKIAA